MRALVLTGVVAGLAALFLSAPRAAAQGRAGTDRPVDRIVAIVGTKPILASQVEEQLVLAQSQGVKMPEDSAGRDAARRQVLSQMVDEELLVQQAERDTTIKVTDQEVQDAVEQTVQNVRKQFTSIPEFQTQLRLEFRDRGELLAHVLDGLLDRVLHFLIRHLDRGVPLRLLDQ